MLEDSYENVINAFKMLKEPNDPSNDMFSALEEYVCSLCWPDQSPLKKSLAEAERLPTTGSTTSSVSGTRPFNSVQ